MKNYLFSIICFFSAILILVFSTEITDIKFVAVYILFAVSFLTAVITFFIKHG